MIISKKRNGKIFYTIQLSCTDKFGKRHQPKFSKTPSDERITSRKTAEKLSLIYYADFMAKLNGDFSQLQFKEWHRQFLDQVKHTYKKSTIMQYDSGLNKWLTISIAGKRLSEITRSDIHHFIFEEMIQNGATDYTRKKVCKSLRRIFQMALDEGLIAKNPVAGVKVDVPKATKLVLNTQEVNKLLEEARRVDHPYYFHWALALFTGMRNGELYGIRWADIDEVAGTINVSSQYTSKDGYHSTKNKESRIVPLSKAAREILIELKGLGPFNEQFVLPSGESKEFDDLVLPRCYRWKHGEQAKILKQFCNSIGITAVSFHDLRATFITNMLSQGVSVPKVMSIVGHSRIETTNEYLRLSGVPVKGTIDLLGYSLPRQTGGKVIQLYN